MDQSDQTTSVLQTGCFGDERRCDTGTLQKMGRPAARDALRKIIDRQQQIDFAAEIAASDPLWPESPLRTVRDEWEMEEDDGTFALHVRRVFAWRRADDTPVGSFTWDAQRVLNPSERLSQERLVDPDHTVRVDGQGEPAQMLRYVFLSADATYPGLWKRVG